MIPNNLNINLKNLRPSATLAINELTTKLSNEGIEIFKLGFGQSPFPVPKEIVQALQNNAHQKDYLPVKGLLQLRQVVSLFFNENYKLPSNAEDILIGPGSKELIYNFQLAYNIDELLLPSPSWVSYEPQAQLNNRKTVWLKTEERNSWKISSADIINHCENSPHKNRVLILNYPSNPIGCTYSATELEDLAGALRKYKIIVIADEIYGEVTFKGNHKTIASYYPEGTIISTGLSKWAGAGGWRLGVFVFPENLRYILNAMAIIASETYTSTSAPIQYAAVEAYKMDDELKIYLHNTRRILETIGLYVYHNLLKLGVTMPKPEGGFYLFPNFSKWNAALHKKGILTSRDFCNALIKETGVALLPGEDFGHPKNRFTARLSFVDFDGTLLLKILEEKPSTILDDTFIEEYCPKIVKATKKISEWVKSI
jgi:aspartate aminotransferase